MINVETLKILLEREITKYTEDYRSEVLTMSGGY